MHKPQAPEIFSLDQLEPNPFHTPETRAESLAEWERYLAQLRQMPDSQENLLLQNSIAHAERLIELKRRAS
jgi:hypothetical protein